jgi:hypothetical protein
VAEPARPLLITRWTTRRDMSPRAIRPGYVGIDERGFADILAESVQLGRSLVYYDERDVPAGTWERMLASDRTPVLALLATLDRDTRTAAVEALVRHARIEQDPERREELFGRLIESVLQLARDLDSWLEPVEEMGGDRHMLEHEIRHVLAPRLHGLLGLVAAVERAGLMRASVTIRIDGLRSLWLIDAVETAERAFDPDGWMDSVFDELVDHVDGFVAGVAALAARSAAAFDSSLGDDKHAPHVGLLMAFIRLFRHAQEELNRLPERIATFYQEEVLRERPRSALPDKAFLAFTPVPGAPPPEIAKGTLFPAGQDEAGAPIRFAADDRLIVSGAKLAEIRIWQPVPGDGEARQRVNAIAAPLPPDGAIGLNPFATPGLPPVRMGLILAAPLLELRSGARRVTLRFEGLDPEEAARVPADLLKTAFRLSFTSPEGWVDVPVFDSEVGTDSIAFTFAIAAEGPPLAAKVRPPAGADAPEPDAPLLPAVRLVLSQEPAGGGAPLDLLGGLRFGSVRIEVAVDGLSGLAVSTPTGLASAAPGVTPFGSPPMPGGWLRIDHEAFAAAPIDRIALGLIWLALPADADGFAGYYRQYVVRPDRTLSTEPLFADDMFRVDACAPVGSGKMLRDQRLFTPVSEAPPPAPAEAYEGMEVSETADGVPAASDVLQKASAPPDPTAGDTRALRGTSWFAFDGDSPPGSGDECPNRAILLTLTGPEHGFGDALYPANLAYASALIAAGDGQAVPRPSLDKRVAAALGALLDKSGDVLFLPPALLVKTLKWIRDLIFIRTDFYDRPDGVDPAEELPPESDGPVSPAAVFPNPPWRPALAGIRLDYVSHAAWSGEDGAEGALDLYHIVPLDGLVAVALEGKPGLLPPLPERPCFDLRIEDWHPEQALSLLFLSGPPRGGHAPPGLAFAWRSGDVWTPFDAAAIADGTGGLAASGIVTLRRPAGTSRGILAPGRVGKAVDPFWLRIAAKGDGGAFPAILRVLPDALPVTRFEPEARGPMPPVPAGTIEQAPGIRGIARVEQPLASFGGAPAELEGEVIRRTSARLRHKERAVLGWDYEHLLLERFPGIDRVRVLAASAPGREAGSAPGHVTAMVLSGSAPDPGPPALTPEARDSIAGWLRERCSPFASIHVIDPISAPVDVRVAACFGRSDGPDRLKADLEDLLSPRAADGLGLPDHAGRRSVQARILQFVRSRPYVSAVESVEAVLGGPDEGWRVPVAGSISVQALARATTSGC